MGFGYSNPPETNIMHNNIHSQGVTEGSATICPFVPEPDCALKLSCYPPGTQGRQRLTAMIETLFAAAYDARVSDFCDDLIGLESGNELLGVAGLRRCATDVRLFSEQYLDAPVDQLIHEQTGQTIARGSILEIGNLAVNGRGRTRWLFAVMTAFLHAAGYEWVVCTAISPLISLFRRLGLEPQVLAPADPARLEGDPSVWGRYYEQNPQVCFGSISAGYLKMSKAITPRQPRLRALWLQAQEAGHAYARQPTDATLIARQP